ncbi:MAG: hypothetical protein ACRC8S_16550 [Fimbriiglobus sp.]
MHVTHKTGFLICDLDSYEVTDFKRPGWRIEFVKSKMTSSALEIQIVARSMDTAKRVASNIFSAMTLLHGGSKSLPESSLYEISDRLPQTSFSAPGFPAACQIATKISAEQDLEYALAKYRLSCDVSSFSCDELNPDKIERIPCWTWPEDHVRLATAIVLAYSVLEQIKLEIRATTTNPSSIDGQWNPVVKSELEKRLEDAGVSLKDEVAWCIRGKSFESTRPKKHLC